MLRIHCIFQDCKLIVNGKTTYVTMSRDIVLPFRMHLGDILSLDEFISTEEANNMSQEEWNALCDGTYWKPESICWSKDNKGIVYQTVFFDNEDKDI